jgi:putative transposase
MPNYRRAKLPGGTYFLTQVTHHRQPWLITDIARLALRAAITHVRQKYPFTIDAFVLLPDHFHCLWTLPEGDSDLSTRLRLIKTFVTKKYGSELEINADISTSRQKRQERNLWQRRFWEHLIRDDRDFAKPQRLYSLQSCAPSALFCSSRLEIFYHSSVDGWWCLSAKLGND